MSKDKYLSSLSQKRGYRIMAWICIAIILAIVVVTFITGITGSKYFLGCLFLCISVPIMMYIMLWFGRLLYNKAREDENMAEKEENQTNIKTIEK